MYRGDGRAFVAKGACIDSGGHHTQEVYKFCKARIGRRVWAIKGESAPGWPAVAGMADQEAKRPE